MATISIADKLAKLEKKIAKREKAIADETKELDKDKSEYSQTLAEMCVNSLAVLLPYKITLLSNAVFLPF